MSYSLKIFLPGAAVSRYIQSFFTDDEIGVLPAAGHSSTCQMPNNQEKMLWKWWSQRLNWQGKLGIGIIINQLSLNGENKRPASSLVLASCMSSTWWWSVWASCSFILFFVGFLFFLYYVVVCPVVSNYKRETEYEYTLLIRIISLIRVPHTTFGIFLSKGKIDKKANRTTSFFS